MIRKDIDEKRTKTLRNYISIPWKFLKKLSKFHSFDCYSSSHLHLNFLLEPCLDILPYISKYHKYYTTSCWQFEMTPYVLNNWCHITILFYYQLENHLYQYGRRWACITKEKMTYKVKHQNIEVQTIYYFC